MDVFLDFEGVESAYYVWVNGELAGYAEDSRLPSHFNITKLLKKGNNRLAVKVFRYSDGLPGRPGLLEIQRHRTECLSLRPPPEPRQGLPDDSGTDKQLQGWRTKAGCIPPSA